MRQYRSRIRRDSRTIPLHGDDERGNGLDDGRYFRCWNCGFVCNQDRDALGGPESGDGITYERFNIPTYGSDGSTPGTGVARVGGSLAATVVPELDAAGDAKQPFVYTKPVVSGGCPFCGTLNWRGDYP